MAINFPGNPSINDTFIVSGTIFTWTGVKWKSTAITEISSDTSPQLGGTLDANSQNINNVNDLVVTGISTFSGSINASTVFSSGTLYTVDQDNNFGSYSFGPSANGLLVQTSSSNYKDIFLNAVGGNVKIGTGVTINNTAGIITATAFVGDGSNLVSGRWTLGANGTSDYTFTGIGFTQTTNDPTLYLKRGEVYEFVNNSGGSHPFQIRETNGGAAYNNGVTNNGAASGTITFAVPYNAPDTLYYQCMNHSNMGGDITILGGGGGGGGISAANWINAL